MPGNLAHNLTGSARRHPERTAVRVDDSEWSYAALDDATARVAALLRAKGLRPGDRVGIMLPNVPYFPIVFYGVLRAGGVVVPVNLLLKEREVTYYLHDSGATRILAWHGCAGVAETAARKEGAEITVVTPGDFETLMAGAEPSDGVADRDGGDTAVILYTSGTTGTPKGAELTHDNLRRNVEAAIMLFGLDAGSVVFGALPLFHAFGQTCAMNAAIAAGGCLTLLPRFTPDGALDIIERHGVTVFEGVPTMYTALLHHPQRQAYDVPALRVCASGGAALPVEVLHGFEEPFGCAVLEGYGLSETSPVASFNHPDRPRRPGSIGTPIEGVEMRVVDDQGRRVATGEVGEIVIRGHNVMKGYWNRPEATAEVIKDGWFHSGDMARCDEDGYFYIVDRKKDLIIRGGYNVYPREIEEVLYEHPAVREAAVVGIPDDQLGEEVGAAVVLAGGATATAEELREHVKGQVAAYKYPRHVWLVGELPKGPTGKILKREITLPEELVATS
jgi:long-chain acyl-CoA synthetase